MPEVKVILKGEYSVDADPRGNKYAKLVDVFVNIFLASPVPFVMIMPLPDPNDPPIACALASMIRFCAFNDKRPFNVSWLTMLRSFVVKLAETLLLKRERL